MRFYPLNQRDLATLSKGEEHKFNYSKEYSPESMKNIKVINPSNDYTPPSYITLLFTELGVLTPSAVSDELIKLYY
jgi:translation initiation factor eIF-2B subunit alpha